MITEIRQYLEERGWCQGSLFEGEPGESAACLQGAFNWMNWDKLCFTLHVDEERDKVGRLLADAIRELYPDFRCCSSEYGCSMAGNWHMIIKFNDDEHTSYEDIMRVVKYAEERER